MSQDLADKIYEKFAGKGGFAWRNCTDTEDRAKKRASYYVEDAIARTNDVKQPWFQRYEARIHAARSTA